MEKKPNKLNTVYLCVLYLLSIMYLFVNDFLIVDVYPAFYFIWIALVVFRSAVGYRISASEIRVQIIVAILLSPAFTVEIYFNGYTVYSHAYIYVVLSCTLFFTFPYLFLNYKSTAAVSVALMLALALFSFLTLFLTGVRDSFIFGPNVMYRIYAVIYAFILIGMVSNRQQIISQKLFILSSLAYIVASAATLARGASLTMVLMGLVALALLWRGTSKWKVIIALPIITSASYILLGYFGELLWRLSYIDFNNTSESLRIGFIQSTLDFASIENGGSLYFGVSSENRYLYTYPHNILLESFVYGGVYLAIVTFFCIAIFLLNIIRRNQNQWISILMLGILTGSMISGNLFYNGTILACGILLACMHLSPRIRRSFYFGI